jgi:hypothetical protein
LTEREMTALLAVDARNAKEAHDGGLEEQARPKFREQGKMGRMSEFKQLTDEDIADAALQAELESDPEYKITTMDGTLPIALALVNLARRSHRQATILAKRISTSKPLADNIKKSKDKNTVDIGEEFGWIALLLTDPDSPTSQTWLNKYASSN